MTEILVFTIPDIRFLQSLSIFTKSNISKHIFCNQGGKGQHPEEVFICFVDQDDNHTNKMFKTILCQEKENYYNLY